MPHLFAEHVALVAAAERSLFLPVLPMWLHGVVRVDYCCSGCASRMLLFESSKKADLKICNSGLQRPTFSNMTSLTK